MVLIAESLDSLIDYKNDIRLIELFVESININEFGFITKKTKEGRPAYHPKDLLKLYIYGYLNSMRSSRVLEKECQRNIEVMWLMKQLTPDHNTISNFRRDNQKAIKKVFRMTVSIGKDFELIGGKLIAGDSTKLRAQNSKKNNFNAKKIDKHIAYIDAKLEEYNQALEQADEDQKQLLSKKIVKHQSRKGFYNDLSAQLESSGEVQISTSDPDSRQLITRNNITEVGYNIQTTVDDKHKLILDYKVTNSNDSKAMGMMLRRAEKIIGSNTFIGLYDKGYHTGSELATAINRGITTMVAIPEVSSSSMAPNPKYNVSQFKYDKEQNSYECPQGNKLTTNGRWYKKDRNAPRRKASKPIEVQHYKTNSCKGCPVLKECTKNTKGRVIERSQYQEYVDINRQNLEANAETYKKRQAIIEHTYGIIKRQWGFYFISTKRGIKRASSEVGLIMSVFNLRRIFNIVDNENLKEYFKKAIKRLKRLFSAFLPTQSLTKHYTCIFIKINLSQNFFPTLINL